MVLFQLPTEHTISRLGRLPTCIVLHDTVGHSVKASKRYLDKKGYSTHYLIDRDGSIWQCAQPRTHGTIHCKGLNEVSIGIDVSCILDPNLATAAERALTIPRHWSAAKDPWKGRIVDYTTEQARSLVDLVKSLCSEFDIPRNVLGPLQPFGKPRKDRDIGASFRGCLAHGQWSSVRWDGLRAAELLLIDGFDAA